MSDHDFAESVREAIVNHGVTPVQIADELRVNVAAINRWASCQTLPPRYARRIIVDRIAALVERVQVGSQQKEVE